MRAFDFLKNKYDLSDFLAEELAKELEGKEERKWDYYCIKWLIERFGKKEGWDYIHNRCFRIIRGIVRRLLSGDGVIPEDREDLEMEIELELYKCIEKYRGDGSLGSYILTIGKRVKGRWKKRGGEVLHSDLVEDIIAMREDSDEWEEEDIKEAISQLPPIYKSIFILQLEGFTLAEIAVKLGSPPGTIRKRYWVGMKKLKDILEGKTIKKSGEGRKIREK
jgi:RNA polymerase sigma factor (sigma-70 family)